MISKISILGYRGFEEKQSLKIAQPSGENGSGLTIVVGPNNAGKSSIIESIKAISSKQHGNPSFTEGKRNKVAGDKVAITVFDNQGNSLTLKTPSEGGSEARFESKGIERENFFAFVISSRRAFVPYFSKSFFNREEYLRNDSLQAQRSSTNDLFQSRLFTILRDGQERFNKILSRIITPVPKWTIDQSDTGQYYLKFKYGDNYHTSDGAGEGLLSIFTIVDALYDSQPGDMIVIDEPELSLHPSLQRRLAEVIIEFSSHRQIVVATHSPFFISWEALSNGGSLARVVKERSGSKIYQLPVKFREIVGGLTSNLNNPHILGLDAREIFFLDDRVNIVEGQEDVIFFKRILNILGLKLDGSFFGWGIGGATNLANILQLLADLGFSKVACVLDNNMQDLATEMSGRFPKYLIQLIPTDDIRDKKAVKAKEAVHGLIDTAGKSFKNEYSKEISHIAKEINSYFNS